MTNRQQRAEDMRELVEAAAKQVAAQAKARRRYLAAILADTRPPDDGGVEGEWAIRLWDAGVRPPLPTPHGFTDWGEA